MQLTGRPDAIKEYNIAVEGLGRGGDFDQKKDSIVRVEAHRLRRRLAEYYQSLGADDPIEILLPPGTYVPIFRPRNPPVAERARETPAIETSPDPTPRRKNTPDLKRWIVFCGIGILTAIALLAFVRWRNAGALTAARSREAEPLAAAPGVTASDRAIRIAAGGTSDGIADNAGNIWQRDQFYTGGEVKTATPRAIRRTLDPSLYLTRRQGDFQYRIPAPAGFYELQLHFAETVFGEDNVAGGGESSRVFAVQVNGGPPWQADIVSDAAGPNTATVRVYRGVRPGPDGTIDIAFTPYRKEAPFINAIEVLPTPDARMLPVRLVARTTAVTTAPDQKWLADRYWLGGQNVLRHEPIDGPEQSQLYQGERYGNFSYAIPVAVGGTYSLTLRFAETWFGEGRPGGEGIGARIFDVYCNGRRLLKDFDVMREAGGPMRQLKKIFRGLEANAQGKLNLQFVPIRNYALINAIEVVDEGR
jgi:hypothetical protein